MDRHKLSEDNVLRQSVRIGTRREFLLATRPTRRAGATPKERTATMSRLKQITPETASDRARPLLDAVKTRLGFVPNMMRAMASSPAVLDGYVQFSGALGRGSLPARAREQISLAVAQANGCGYCLAAHSAIGKTV